MGGKGRIYGTGQGIEKKIIYISVIPGKKSASWQLVAVVLGLKTMPRGKKRRKASKYDVKWPKPSQNQRRNSPKNSPELYRIIDHPVDLRLNTLQYY